MWRGCRWGAGEGGTTEGDEGRTNRAMNYTVDEAKRDFTPRLRWGQVVEMLGRLGLTEWSARVLLESGAVTRILYPGRKRAYYDRDQVLKVVLKGEQGEEEKA